MNFTATKTLTDTVGKYVSAEKLNIKSNGHKDYWGREYTADFVEIFSEEPNRLSFEVTENEIIVFFFTDHIHFEDYTFDLNDGEPDYIQRAAEFLDKLFTLPIALEYMSKGNRIIKSESFFISDNEKESCAGKTLSSAGIKNIFKKKRYRVEIKKFDRTLGKFVKVGIHGMLLSEIIEKMYDKSLGFQDEIQKIIYSKDKSLRYVILKKENGIFYYVFEKINLYDEEVPECLKNDPNAVPAYWNGFSTPRSFFGTLEDAVKNLKFEVEYMQYFE